MLWYYLVMTTVEIQKEINLLKSFAISILGEDKEGSYNSKFVKDTLKATSEKVLNSFENKEDFLKLLKK